MKKFKRITPRAIKKNAFERIGEDWMLIAAGSKKKYNMMTASWGGFGVLWHKNVCFCFIRPGRYTYQFMEKSKYFTLNFFPKKYKKALMLCGAKSGRDINKTLEAGLTAGFLRRGAVYFSEAQLVIECKKIYTQQINPKFFLDASIGKNYPHKDYHRLYVGEVVSVLKG